MQTMSIAEARAHYGFAVSVSDAVVEAAAEADGIEIRTENPGGNGDGSLTGAIDQLREAQEALRTAGQAATETQRQNAATLEADVTKLLAGSGLEVRGQQEEREVETAISDRFDQLDYDGSIASVHPLSREQRDANTRANLELAMMIFGGTSQMASTPTLEVPDELQRAWQYHVFEAPGSRPMVTDGNGNPRRAMDTAESGFGLDLIGTQYVSELWRAARQLDGLVGRIREIPMTAATTIVPIDGDLPEMLFVGESTSASASAYSTSKTGSSKATLTAKKFTIQQVWSGELEEDSIIAFTPFLREKLNASAGLYLGSSYLNGDTTNASTGNINSDDADPTDTKHFLAYDGINHYWIVDATGQGKDMAAALDPTEIVRARGKLNGGDDDVDSLIKNVNWGTDARALLAVMDWDTYMAMLELDVVKTVDQYGSQATVVTGELGAYSGIPLVAPSYSSKTQADGKASGTETNNIKGRVTVLNPAGFLAGRRREMQLFFDRIQGTDQFRFELYTRRAFIRFGGNVSAGVYDITV
jgi:HK97 family phage major capsid protein